MRNCIGIRRETKDPTERRAPLTPLQVRALIESTGLKVLVQPSPQRAFPDRAYQEAGAVLRDDLSEANIVFGIKEIPVPDLQPEMAYCFFSHTVKGQPYNMPMLKRLLELKDSLLDYELVRNKQGRRLIAFGEFAGYAGMIDSLWALGRRLAWEGIDSPFQQIQPAHRYGTLVEAQAALRRIARDIRRHGLPEQLVPLVCGFTGRGRVAQGAQMIYDLFPVVKIPPEELPRFMNGDKFSNGTLYKVAFNKAHLYRPRVGQARIQEFNWYEFNTYPERYEGQLEQYLPYLTLLINGIYWEPRFPRLVTREGIRRLFEQSSRPRLRVIGDITCDIEGSIEITVKATNMTNPVYVYHPQTGRIQDGWEGEGVVMMAVDKLPTELPLEASEAFGKALLPFVPDLAATDFCAPLDRLTLPPAFRKALIVHQGHLTPDFEYLRQHLP